MNYTFPLHATLNGDPVAAFHALGEAQGAGYSAYLNLGSHHLLCLSPELFFEREPQENRCGGVTVEQCDGEPQKRKAHALSGIVTPPHRHTATPAFWRLVMRPMKGTLARGRFPAEDLARMRELAACEKNRAENLMILDMLRNDAGRLALPGTVRVPRMFEVERYRTVLQMTSTVEATLPGTTTLPEIFAALFPCGSITGAPKVRTMQIIRELEKSPRGAYTGAIGLLKPDGSAIFNVAIRSITLEPQKSGGAILAPPETPGGCQRHSPLLTAGLRRSQTNNVQDWCEASASASSATPGVESRPYRRYSPEGFGSAAPAELAAASAATTGGSGNGGECHLPDFCATFGVGGGVTWDSTPAGEYDECMLKAAFLTATPSHCHTAQPDFDLLESLRLEDGQWFLLERHLERMRASADYFGRAFPEADIRAALASLRGSHPAGAWKVRLLTGPHGIRCEAQPLSGGGILPPPETPGEYLRYGQCSTADSRSPQADGPHAKVQACDTGATAIEDTFPPANSANSGVEDRLWRSHSPEGFGERRERHLPDIWRVAVAAAPVDSRDIFLFHKTTRRGVYDAALKAHPGAKDVLLWNERGELTESCFANIVLAIGGELVTPPVECGLLAGTFRQELLERGIIRECVLRKEDLAKADAAWLINSVRGWIRAELEPQTTRQTT